MSRTGFYLIPIKRLTAHQGNILRHVRCAFIKKNTYPNRIPVILFSALFNLAFLSGVCFSKTISIDRQPLTLREQASIFKNQDRISNRTIALKESNQKQIRSSESAPVFKNQNRKSLSQHLDLLKQQENLSGSLDIPEDFHLTHTKILTVSNITHHEGSFLAAMLEKESDFISKIVQLDSRSGIQILALESIMPVDQLSERIQNQSFGGFQLERVYFDALRMDFTLK